MSHLAEPRVFKLTGAASFKNTLVDLRRDGIAVLPAYCGVMFPPGIMEDTGPAVNYRYINNWRYHIGGGLGDKIYAIPAVFASVNKVGIDARDFPLFRLTTNVRLFARKDIRATSAIGVTDSELVDQIAERMGVSDRIKLRMPVLETTAEEKSIALSKRGYVVLYPVSGSPARCWKSYAEFLVKGLDRNVIVFEKRDPSQMAVVEGADCVISCNTSGIPMAGALQVPLVSIEAKNRTGYFLDTIDTVDDPDAVISAYKFLMQKKRLRCWCGESKGEYRIENNIVIIKCRECATDRQDVKYSFEAIEEFYAKVYHFGWRELVERETPYETREDEDRALAQVRLNQWSVSKGRNWLDVGSCTGCLLDVLRERGWSAFGLEPSENMVSAFKSKAAVLDSGIKFDVVSYVDCMEHTDVAEELIFASKCLNKNGTLVVEIPLAHEEPKHYRRLQHLFFFTVDTFNACLNEHGFEVQKIIHPISGRLGVVARRNQ